MSVPVRDAKIYVEILKQIVIGYETKGSIMNLSVEERNNGKMSFIRFDLTTDKWLITPPNYPRALTKNRADIYIDLTKAGPLIKNFETIDKNHPNVKRVDCPGLKGAFFPEGLEQGPKKLPEGVNCFRAPIVDAILEIADLNTRLKPLGGELFIDFEINDKSHLLQFTTPALHFALRAPFWSSCPLPSGCQNRWIIDVDINCEKAILEALKTIYSLIP